MATNYWYQTWQVYPQINMKNVSILPDEGFDVRIRAVEDHKGAPLGVDDLAAPEPVAKRWRIGRRP